jgi:hypothetical protein
MEQHKAFSIQGKSSECCGKTAVSGKMLTGGGAIYWCSERRREVAGILNELIKSRKPELVAPILEEHPFLREFGLKPGLLCL